MAKVELFYMPSSFYSQKARLSLEEKGIHYKGTFVSLVDSEQCQPWYLKINPNGEVPALKIGDECFAESANIIEIVDKLPSDSRPPLIPDPVTPEGQLVSEWTQKINALPVGVMTYGVMLHPELSVEGLASGLDAFKPTKEGLKIKYENSIKKFEEDKLRYPEMKKSYDKKISDYKERLISFFDKNRTVQVLADVDSLMDDIERQLIQMSSENDGEFWLCGNTFTSADINLCVLLGRFAMLGLLPRFADSQRRPTVVKYWKQAQARPTVQKVILNIFSEIRKYFLARKAQRYGSILLGVGVVVAAVWMAHRHIRK